MTLKRDPERFIKPTFCKVPNENATAPGPQGTIKVVEYEISECARPRAMPLGFRCLYPGGVREISPRFQGVLPKYRSAVVLDRSNIRTGFFIRTPPSHSDRSFRLFIDCGFGQHALTSAATWELPLFNGLLSSRLVLGVGRRP